MIGIQQAVLVAMAGAVGALLRYATQQGVIGILGSGFPYGTLVVNVLGSFLIGVLFVLLDERALGGELLRLVLMVGVLGSFTTFSAFSLDTWILVQNGYHVKAAVNVLGNVLVCLLATGLGIGAARVIH